MRRHTKKVLDCENKQAQTWLKRNSSLDKLTQHRVPFTYEITSTQARMFSSKEGNEAAYVRDTQAKNAVHSE